MSSTSSTKPYLIRALHEWCIDQGLTPYIAVKVDQRTRVPAGFVRDGQIVLNLATHATHQLRITNTEITCQARFGGVAHSLYVPVDCVMAIYARENGEGMFFEVHSPETPDAVPAADEELVAAEDEKSGAAASGPGRSHLRVIK